MATKNYLIGPGDGWVKVITTTAKASLQISAFPHTQPFYVFGDPTATPVVGTDIGILVCHKPFKLFNSTTAGNVEAFWVRVVNPKPDVPNGRVRFDVHTDGAATA